MIPSKTQIHEAGVRTVADLCSEFSAVRAVSRQICSPLQAEDCLVQSMPDVSPPKWHLAHTTWFFENFILKEYVPGYRPFNERYNYIFNSYYETVGQHHPRAERGLLSRPALPEVLKYRDSVDGQMLELMKREGPQQDRIAQLVTLGLHHEQQHQELLLTDIQHILFSNPLQPAYQVPAPVPVQASPDAGWIEYPEGLFEIGFNGSGFSFDNERPRHRVFLEAFALCDRPVTNGEFIEFIRDGGYQEPRLWLSEGWDILQSQGWAHPFYWRNEAGAWRQWTLAGWQSPDFSAPLCSVSYFEADAFARWAGQRLPTEAEWEIAASAVPLEGNFFESGVLRPMPAASSGAIPRQLFGDVWEWTQSPYVPYPRFRPEAGSIGEYNGKFMCNQWVLRGGSCLTSQSHLRPSYRNFFPAQARWQCSGFRLAKEVP